jgi:hypothetical protein
MECLVGFKIETTVQYKEYIEEAYEPDLSKNRAEELLKGFLYYKATTANQQFGTPQKAEDVIIHLQNILASDIKKSSKGSSTISFVQSIISAFIAGIFILVAWQFLDPLF